MALKWFSLKILGSTANKIVANIDLCWVFRKATLLKIFLAEIEPSSCIFLKVLIIFDIDSDCLSVCSKT